MRTSNLLQSESESKTKTYPTSFLMRLNQFTTTTRWWFQPVKMALKVTPFLQIDNEQKLWEQQLAIVPG